MMTTEKIAWDSLQTAYVFCGAERDRRREVWWRRSSEDRHPGAAAEESVEC